MSKNREFNAVAEGTFYDDITTIYYKLIFHLDDIPKDKTIINDLEVRYVLHGTTEDFETISNVNLKNRTNNLEIRLKESLSSWKGLVLNKDRSQYLEMVRTIFLDDGRIFIRKGLPPYYINHVLPEKIIIHAGKIFDNKDYDKILKLYKQQRPAKIWNFAFKK